MSMIVPASKHTLFMRGFNSSTEMDKIRDFFIDEGGQCTFVFNKLSQDNQYLFVALRFDSSKIAEAVKERFDGQEILGQRVQVTWFKDLRKAKQLAFQQGTQINFRTNRGGSAGNFRRPWSNQRTGAGGNYGRNFTDKSSLKTWGKGSRNYSDDHNHSRSRSNTYSNSSHGSYSRSVSPSDSPRRPREKKRSHSSSRSRSGTYSSRNSVERTPSPKPKRSKRFSTEDIQDMENGKFTSENFMSSSKRKSPPGNQLKTYKVNLGSDVFDPIETVKVGRKRNKNPEEPERVIYTKDAKMVKMKKKSKKHGGEGMNTQGDPFSQSVAGFSDESIRIIHERKEEIEQAYRQDCETFATVIKMLVSKDPSLEELIQDSLRQNLQEIGQRCLQELQQVINELRSQEGANTET